MRRHFQLAALTITLVSATAVAAAAQDSVRARERQPRTFMYNIGPDAGTFTMRRGRLGITVDLRPDAVRDTMGARVSSVTPGGPADHAGVQTGDIITRLNGARVVGEASRNDDDEDQSRPGMRLVEMASRLQAGDTVRLDIKRDNRPLTLTFQADHTDMDGVVERMRTLGGPTFDRAPFMMGMGEAGPRVGGNVRISVMGHGLGDMELVTVTPALAEGLGISEGVLVVSIDSASTLGLRAGDVITSIAGRHPTSPAHAMRILGSYDVGESVSFDVMRHGRRAAVTGKIPENRRSEWRIRPDMFEQEDDRDGGDFDGQGMQQMMERMRELPRMQQQLREMPRMLRLDGKV